MATSFTEDKFEDIIIESLQFWKKENKVKLYAFTLMGNHIYFVWQTLYPTIKVKPHHSFIAFILQKIKDNFKNCNTDLLDNDSVYAKDRIYLI
ncbi:MAG: hypothetical protein LH615_09865 [Ferruginibacter sp.]|nr:hypothetical protein [Ferruginibacter sp.]